MKPLEQCHASSAPNPRVAPSSRAPAEPVILSCRDRALACVVVSADPFGGVLETPAARRAPPVGARLLLSGADGGLGPVVFVATVTATLRAAGPADAGRRLAVEWAEVAATGARQTLIDALGRVMGLRARRTSPEDQLSPERLLVYDAVARQVRLTTLSERPDLAHALTDAPAAPQGPRAAIPYGLRARTQPRILVDTGRPQPAPAPDAPLVVQLGRKAPRPMPVYRCPAAPGTWSAAGGTSPMEVTLIGLSHCLFVMPGVDAPAIGTDVELAIPADPVGPGHILVSGQVSLVTADAHFGRTFVEVDLQARQLPPLYHRLVMHWGRRA